MSLSVRFVIVAALLAGGMFAFTMPTAAAEECQFFDLLDTEVCSITKGETKAERADLSWSTATYDEQTYKFRWEVYEPTKSCEPGDVFVARMRAETFMPHVVLRNYGGGILATSALAKGIDPASRKPFHVAEVQWRCTGGGGPPVVQFTMVDVETPGPFDFDWVVWNVAEAVEPPAPPEQASDCSCFDPGKQSYYPSTGGVCGPPPTTQERQAATWRCF